MRNRALTDIFEPGSTLKPFTIAAALEAGKVQPSTIIDTAPGTLTIGAATIHDAHREGVLTVEQVIQKSSNVGAAKIALSLPAEKMWERSPAPVSARRRNRAFPARFPGACARRRAGGRSSRRPSPTATASRSTSSSSPAPTPSSPTMASSSRSRCSRRPGRWPARRCSSRRPRAPSGTCWRW